MNHAPLQRARANQSYFNDKVIEIFRQHARQSVHLRAGFNLENTDGFRPTDHRVGFFIIRGNGGEIEMNIFMLQQKIATLS
ncbi:hypothetical protein D3C87_2083740 [compost metagenome]